MHLAANVRFFAFLFIGVILFPSVSVAQSEEFLRALSHRHGDVTLAGLEKIAGSREAVIEGLLLARHKENPPFAGIMAAKLLLTLADRADVQQALQEDLSSNRYAGLARVITVHLDKVPDAEFRSRLARTAIDRAQRDDRFKPYAKSLMESTDPEVSRMAKESLQ